MKSLLRAEQFILFAASIFVFSLSTTLPWYFYAGLFLTPDSAFIGYAVNPKIGAWCYNALHHQGIWMAVALAGFSFGIEWLLGLGIVYVGHSAFDRVLGYGLKHQDSFNNTHLGTIGKSNS